MPYVTVNDDRLFYVSRSRGEGPALVFVHGAGETHRIWGLQVRELRECQAYALDLPGHGRSEGEGSRSMAEYSERLREFLDALEIERAMVIGHSMGGAIAQRFALDHPDRLTALGLIGTGARLRVLPALLDGLRQDFAATIEQIVRLSFAEGADAALVQQAEDELLNNRPEVVHNDFVACDQFDVMGRLGEIALPTLIICGEEDRLTPPKYARYLDEHLPNSELRLIEGAGHSVSVEKPAQVTAAIQEFVQRHVSQTGPS